MNSRIGVISDTHGLLRPEAIHALKGCGQIIHAGDIGSPDILPRLRSIAPLTAVRGNIDREPWAEDLPADAAVSAGGVSLYVVHDVDDLGLDPAAAGIDAVISGHSHKPSIRLEQGILYLNPGSAGPRRFGLPVTLAILVVAETGSIKPRLVTLL
jgi:putative phosphoesterase